MCCSFEFLSVLNVSLILGTTDAEILRSPLLKAQSSPKSRVVHLEDKQILKSHILSYPNIIVSKNPPPHTPPTPRREGGGGVRVLIAGPWGRMQRLSAKLL